MTHLEFRVTKGNSYWAFVFGEDKFVVVEESAARQAISQGVPAIVMVWHQKEKDEVGYEAGYAPASLPEMFK